MEWASSIPCLSPSTDRDNEKSTDAFRFRNGFLPEGDDVGWLLLLLLPRCC
jgi:hypothetical protein